MISAWWTARHACTRSLSRSSGKRVFFFWRQPQALERPADRRLTQGRARWQRRQTGGVLGQGVVAARRDQPGQEPIPPGVGFARGPTAMSLGRRAAAFAYSAAHVAHETHAHLETLGNLDAGAPFLLAGAPHPLAQTQRTGFWHSQQPARELTQWQDAPTLRGTLEAMCVNGATDGRVFLTFLRDVLVPQLWPGAVVVTDNLGARLLYLPPHSADFNPIEMAWSKLKHFLRKVAARTSEALDRASAEGLHAVSANDAHGFFRHRGDVS